MNAARCASACGAVRECTLLAAAGVRGPEVLAEPCGRVVLAARARQLGVLDELRGGGNPHMAPVSAVPVVDHQRRNHAALAAARAVAQQIRIVARFVATTGLVLEVHDPV